MKKLGKLKNDQSCIVKPTLTITLLPCVHYLVTDGFESSGGFVGNVATNAILCGGVR